MTSGQAVMQHGSCSSWSGFAHSIAPTHPSSFLHIALTHPHTRTHAHTPTHSYLSWHTNRHSTCSSRSAHSRQTFKRTLILGTLKKIGKCNTTVWIPFIEMETHFWEYFLCWIRPSRSRHLRKKRS